MKSASGGLYVVVLSLRRAVALRVGAMGRIVFAPGAYVYVGSAAGGVERRVARHKAVSGKKLRWHIDYLRARASWVGALMFPNDGGECLLAQKAAGAVGGAAWPARFGASDCRCEGHLIAAEATPDKAMTALMAMGGAMLAPGKTDFTSGGLRRQW